MFMLHISVFTCTVFMLATLILTIKRQPKKQEGELIRLSETIFTAVMGGMMLALAFFLLYEKYVNPAAAGTDLTSYVFVGIFAAVCVLSGCCIMLYTFLKKAIICEDKILFVTILGKYKELYWNEITEIKLPFLSNNTTLIGKEIQFAVRGEVKAYKEFIKIAKKKLRPEVVRDIFEKLLNRLMV